MRAPNKALADQRDSVFCGSGGVSEDFILDQSHDFGRSPFQRDGQFEQGLDRWLLLPQLKNADVVAHQIGIQAQLLLAEPGLLAQPPQYFTERCPDFQKNSSNSWKNFAFQLGFVFTQ